MRHVSTTRVDKKNHGSRPLTTIAVVGNINLDVKTSRIATSPGIMADGETSIEDIHESIGGGGANTAVAAAIMGARVHFCGCIGSDELGKRLVRHLRSIGVTPHVKAVPVSTGRSIAMSWDNGHRHFISSLPNTALLDVTAVDVPALARAGCMHLYRADIWFSEPMLYGGNRALFKECRQAGMETSIDVNWDPRWNAGLESGEVRKRIDAVKETLPLASYVHGNEREIMFFCGSQTIERAARSLVEWGAAALIVHKGARGCAAFINGGWIEIPAVPVSKIVSDTGSGDVFTAAFLVHGRLPLAERLVEAGRAAADHLRGTPSYIPPLEETS
ncbi:MAG TPA: carbohydrate kinase family protein [Spirochaetia bacterium]|nr:carbohydrate kinase family protein [Spirochaetia bacterium]